MNALQGMVAVAMIEYEHRMNEAARWRRAAAVERAQREQRSNRLFGRKKARQAISIQE